MMERAWRNALVGLIVIGSFFCVTPVAHAYTNAEWVEVVNSTNEQAGKLSQSVTEDSSSEEIQSIFAELNALYVEASRKIAALSPEGETQTAIQQELVTSLDKLAADTNTVATTQDSAAYSAALTAYDADMDAFNAVIDKANNAFGTTGDDYSGLYTTLVLIFGSISIGLLIASKFSNKLLPSAVAQDALQFELFKSSLWPTIGSIVTLVWYEATPPGGTYYILWGPMGIGALYFLKAYSDYLSQKKELKKMRKGETEQIQQFTQQHRNTTGSADKIPGQSNGLESTNPLHNSDPARKEIIGVGFRHHYNSMFMSDESYNSLDEKKRAQLYKEGLKIHESSPQETEEAISDDVVDTESSDTTNAKMEIIRVGFRRINNINPSDDDLIKMPDRALEHYYKVGLKHISK